MHKMKRNFVPALMAASVFLAAADVVPARASDASDGLFSKQNMLSVEELNETRGLGVVTAEASVESSTTGGGDGGGNVTFGDSTFSNFGGANNNAFATAPGASAVAQMTINVYLSGGAD